MWKWIKRLVCRWTSHDFNITNIVCRYCGEPNPNYFTIEKVNKVKVISVYRKIAWEKRNDITLC